MTENKENKFRALAFFAHPDDETVFLGGTFAYLIDLGIEVHFLCATRGEGGELGDPPVCVREDLGKVREGELRDAIQALGGKSLQFLDYRDPLVGPEGELYPFTDNLEGLVIKIQDEIQRVHPDVIITHGPGGEYGHPAHIQAHQGMMSALSNDTSLNLAVYAPSWLSRDIGKFTPEPDFAVDITPWKKQKTKAMLCHKSQHGLFLRHGSARAGRPITIPEMVRTQEALIRVQPASSENYPDPLAEYLNEISLSTNTQAINQN
ncbi:MAG: PIG-L deacetylase family protein [Anaerolineales bacterium]